MFLPSMILKLIGTGIDKYTDLFGCARSSGAILTRRRPFMTMAMTLLRCGGSAVAAFVSSFRAGTSLVLPRPMRPLTATIKTT